MKARIRAAAVICTAAVMAMTAMAHSGRTDGDGGHYDSSTGEYHYHHGYPAHQHIDIDGDGIPDCPFDFDDKTGQSSGSPGTGSWTGSSNRDYEIIAKTIRETKPEPETEPEVKLEEGKDGRVEATVIACIVTAAVMLWAGNYAAGKKGKAALEAEKKKGLQAVREQQELMNKRVDAERKQRIRAERTEERLREELNGIYRELDRIRSRAEEAADRVIRDPEKVNYQQELGTIWKEVSDLRDQAWGASMRVFIEKYRDNGMDKVQFPKDVTYGGDERPIQGTPSREKPYGGFTVYVTGTGERYHEQKGCCGAEIKRHELELIQKGIRPCRKCVAWITKLPEWYIQAEEIRKK